MSLTGLLATSPDLREAMRLTVRPPVKPDFPPLLCPPLTAHYSQVGTAFDYFLRALLTRTYQTECRVVAGSLIASLAPGLGAGRVARQARQHYRLAQATYDAARSGEIEAGHELAQACLVLAQLEAVVRSGRTEYLELVGETSEYDEYDLLTLAARVPLDRFRPSTRLLLNPGFHADHLVGGADADLLLDDTLIEIKVSKRALLSRQHLQQLVGYLLLQRLAGLREAEEVELQALGVYFARYGLLFTVPVAELFAAGALEDLTRWFVAWRAGRLADAPDLTGHEVKRHRSPRAARPVAPPAGRVTTTPDQEVIMVDTDPARRPFPPRFTDVTLALARATEQLGPPFAHTHPVVAERLRRMYAALLLCVPDTAEPGTFVSHLLRHPDVFRRAVRQGVRFAGWPMPTPTALRRAMGDLRHLLGTTDTMGA